MKLLTKTSIYYIFFSFLTFLIGGILLNPVIKSIFYSQLDENLTTEKLLIVEQINYSDSLPDFRTVFGHHIEVTVFNEPKQKFGYIRSTYIFNKESGKLVPYRHLIAEGTSIKNRGYIISIYKPLEETQNLMTAVRIAMAALFLILMGLLIFVNYFSSRRVWVPFYQTMHNLSKYDISQDRPLELTASTTREFILLNKSLERMSKKIRRDYFNLKEFNENASHELQTPLAVINSKLELLMQSSNLTEEQMSLILSLSESVNRMSKLNQGLLLISKIENNQFPSTETVDLQAIVERTLENFEEFLQMKNITVTRDYDGSCHVRMNRILAEILVSNLVTNSIRHNITDGMITVKLNPRVFKITNTGLERNIDPAKLFERFKKSDRGGDSVGLGLAIVKRIVDFCQMRIEYTVNGHNHTLTVFLNADGDYETPAVL
jgi:signal transduction histidine kinase